MKTAANNCYSDEDLEIANHNYRGLIMENEVSELREALEKIASLLEIAQEFSGSAENALHIAKRALEQ